MDAPPGTPRPDAPFADLDEVAARLGELRTRHGSPSFEEIARRIARRRDETGRAGAPGRVTVFDCFRPGRRRIDLELLHDIVHALSDDPTLAQSWRERTAPLLGVTRSEHVVTVDLPARLPAADDDVPRLDADGVLAITGLPGVGKSTLARAAAETARAEGRVRRVIRVDTRGYHPALHPAAPLDVLRAVAHALGTTPTRADASALRARIAEATRAEPVAVLFEDVRSAADIAPALVRGMHAVVTSRSRLAELAGMLPPEVHVSHHPLAPQSPARTAALLRQRLAPRELSDAPLATLARSTGGIRLNIELIARFAEDHLDWTVDDLVDRFADTGAADAVAPLLDASYRALDERTARTLRLLGMLQAPTPYATVTRALGGDAPALARLESLHLVRVEERTLSLHDAVASFARARLLADEPRSRRRAFAEALVAATLAAAEATAPLSREHAVHLAAAAITAQEHGAHDALGTLADSAVEALERGGHWSELVAVTERATAVAPTPRNAPLAEALARGYEKLGRIYEALLMLHRTRRRGEETLPGRAWNLIGNLHRHLGEYDDAEAAYRAAAETARTAGNPLTEGRALGNLANLRRIVGDTDDADALFVRAAELAAASDDDENTAIVRSNRVLLAIDRGRVDEALADAAALRREGHPALSALALRMLEARALFAAGRAEEAEALLDDADADRNDPFDVPAEALALRARVRRALSRPDEARADAERAWAAGRDGGIVLVLPDARNTLAELDADAERARAAQEHAEAAAADARALHDVGELARAAATLDRISRAG